MVFGRCVVFVIKQMKSTKIRDEMGFGSIGLRWRGQCDPSQKEPTHLPDVTDQEVKSTLHFRQSLPLSEHYKYSA